MEEGAPLVDGIVLFVIVFVVATTLAIVLLVLFAVGNGDKASAVASYRASTIFTLSVCVNMGVNNLFVVVFAGE